WNVILYLRPCRLHAFSAPCLCAFALCTLTPLEIGSPFWALVYLRLELPCASPRLGPLRVTFRDKAIPSWLDVVSSPVECRNSGFRDSPESMWPFAIVIMG
ncbi:hypothetical protein K443DRAFT_657576, partial [Laccaria amethystina LaAM-08-1]